MSLDNRRMAALSQFLSYFFRRDVATDNPVSMKMMTAMTVQLSASTLDQATATR
jgi:hypothetical protein